MKLNTEHLDRCIQTLEGAVEKLNSSVEDSIEYDIFRNASIKGFELTLETSGKLLKKWNSCCYYRRTERWKIYVVKCSVE